jgi:hypothetical protein
MERVWCTTTGKLSVISLARHPITAVGCTIGMELDECGGAAKEAEMHALFWTGLVVLALGILAYIVVKAAIWLAVILFIAGVILMIWGATKVKKAV